MAARLFVGNLSYSTTQAALQRALLADGLALAEVRLVIDGESGRSRGFAFVELARAGDLPRAVEAWNGRVLDGRPLRVRAAEERGPAARTGERGRDGRRGPRGKGGGRGGPHG